MTGAPVERIVLAKAEVTRAGLIASPFQFATDGTDMLRFRLWTVDRRTGPKNRSFAAQIRTVDQDGVSQLTTVPLVPPPSTMLLTQFVPLSAGYVQTCSVTWTGLNVDTLQGPTYCVVDLVRGTLAGAQLVVGQLLGGYTGPGRGLTWPGSPIVGPEEGRGYQYCIAGQSNAGLEFTFTVDQFSVICLRAIVCFFQAAAGGVNRQPTIRVRVSGNTVAQIPFGQPVAPAAGWLNSYGPGYPFSTLASVAQGTSPLPENLMLRFGDSVDSVTASLAAGDQYQAVKLQVEEWIEPLP